MPNRVRVWTTEMLTNLCLVDTTSRPIRYSDAVNVSCHKCSTIFQSQMRYVHHKLRYSRRRPQCRACLLLEMGDNARKQPNNFVNKKHSKTSRKQMRASSAIRWSKVSPEERAKIGASIRSAFLAKYGVDNPMKVSDFRDRAQDASTIYNKSKGELEMLAYVKSLGYEAESRWVDGLQIDIFIPELRKGIEYCGIYWHSERILAPDYHLNKTKHMKKHGIDLIHILDTEWANRGYVYEIINNFLSGIKNGSEPWIDVRLNGLPDIVLGEIIPLPFAADNQGHKIYDCGLILTSPEHSS